jgi:hypothetical protein
LFKAVTTYKNDLSPDLLSVVEPRSVFYTNGTENTRRRMILHIPFLNMTSIHQNLVPKLNALIVDFVLPYFEAAASTGQSTKLEELQ